MISTGVACGAIEYTEKLLGKIKRTCLCKLIFPVEPDKLHPRQVFLNVISPPGAKNLKVLMMNALVVGGWMLLEVLRTKRAEIQPQPFVEGQAAFKRPTSIDGPFVN